MWHEECVQTTNTNMLWSLIQHHFIHVDVVLARTLESQRIISTTQDVIYTLHCVCAETSYLPVLCEHHSCYGHCCGYQLGQGYVLMPEHTRYRNSPVYYTRPTIQKHVKKHLISSLVIRKHMYTQPKLRLTKISLKVVSTPINAYLYCTASDL